ncbi:MAG: hypothetical protein H0T18_01055 [Chloroflexia bacterium]|nr:hypothetical protein [Chloroflexia bacterium]
MINEPEGARTVAIVLNRDLLFGLRIRNALASLGLDSRFVPDADRFVEALGAHGESTAIGIVDMNGAVAWDSVRDALAASSDAPPILAFGPHVDIDGRRAAKGAGVSRIVSNGKFHSDMAGLIDRYRRR